MADHIPVELLETGLEVIIHSEFAGSFADHYVTIDATGTFEEDGESGVVLEVHDRTGREGTLVLPYLTRAVVYGA